MMRVTAAGGHNEQLLYFTSSSLSRDDRLLFFISDRTGHPNVFCRELDLGGECQITRNTEGTLRSYVYFNGNPDAGLGKASISLDGAQNKVYFLQGREICWADPAGQIHTLNRIPAGQVTAFTHLSGDGGRLCVPTTDARALEGYDLNPYDIDERVRRENLSSYLRVYDTNSGTEVASERIEGAWITHVQFCPADPGLILYNHEWPAECGIRRMWLWDGRVHRRLRTAVGKRSKDDWTCHEMWQPDGRHIVYHGKYADGTPYIGRVSVDGDEPVEIALPETYRRYGHFGVGNRHADLLVSDGYYEEDETGVEQAEWISLQKVDWRERRIDWIPLCKHASSWNCQDAHPHPIFNHQDTSVFFTSDRDGKRAIYEVRL